MFTTEADIACTKRFLGAGVKSGGVGVALCIISGDTSRVKTLLVHFVRGKFQAFENILVVWVFGDISPKKRSLGLLVVVSLLTLLVLGTAI